MKNFADIGKAVRVRHLADVAKAQAVVLNHAQDIAHFVVYSWDQPNRRTIFINIVQKDPGLNMTIPLPIWVRRNKGFGPIQMKLGFWLRWGPSIYSAVSDIDVTMVVVYIRRIQNLFQSIQKRIVFQDLVNGFYTCWNVTELRSGTAKTETCSGQSQLILKVRIGLYFGNELGKRLSISVFFHGLKHR